MTTSTTIETTKGTWSKGPADGPMSRLGSLLWHKIWLPQASCAPLMCLIGALGRRPRFSQLTTRPLYDFVR